MPADNHNVDNAWMKIVMHYRDRAMKAEAALTRIADDDVDSDLKGRADVLSGIAWAALERAIASRNDPSACAPATLRR